MNKQHLQLSPNDREYLEALISKGELKAKTYRRALSLLELDRGQTYTAVSKTVKSTIATVSCPGYKLIRPWLSGSRSGFLLPSNTLNEHSWGNAIFSSL